MRTAVQLLVEDADLAEVIPEERRSAAIASCRVPLVSAGEGPWTPPLGAPAGYLGFLVLDGICLRAFELKERRAVVLLGPGDLIKPWTRSRLWNDEEHAEWRFLSPVRLALLDRAFTTQLAQYPELAGELVERVMQRNRELVFNMAIASHTRIDTRLHLMLWQMASKWGRIRPDGVLLPIRLTHAVLSELVASRRPTITTALAELSQRGLVHRVEQGWLLTGDAPDNLMN
ncbi:MAG TPA: Crp/Fnr family transcriptional regulator [Solirubrobacteraceae bacterium]|nr:Crp/Fnr family transcriptional regulator [Solirubrobacteraceae bacterium]